MIPTHGQIRLVRRQLDKKFETPHRPPSPLGAILPPRYLREGGGNEGSEGSEGEEVPVAAPKLEESYKVKWQRKNRNKR
jgi:hypothetical protein